VFTYFGGTYSLYLLQIYERRAKAVRANELSYWQQLTPDMMSDEEKSGEVFVRHQPSYRSDSLNKFLTKLDSRTDKKTSHQPRMPRITGSPVNIDVPYHAKNWMIKAGMRKKKQVSEVAVVLKMALMMAMTTQTALATQMAAMENQTITMSIQIQNWQILLIETVTVTVTLKFSDS
jgi:hypothetical protein